MWFLGDSFAKRDALHIRFAATTRIRNVMDDRLLPLAPVVQRHLDEGPGATSTQLAQDLSLTLTDVRTILINLARGGSVAVKSVDGDALWVSRRIEP
jgi:hypothetical protein